MTTPRSSARGRPVVVALTALVLVAAAVLLLRPGSSSTPTAAPTAGSTSTELSATDAPSAPSATRAAGTVRPPVDSGAAGNTASATSGTTGGRLGIADGEVPDGLSALATGYPALDRLDPDLRAALRRAATAARADGVHLTVTSGWRSRAYQQHLLDRAVATYGSRAAAAAWVATPDTSAHVTGEAVDLGPSSAASWLADHGAEYGLCRVYRNEPWHVELRPEAPVRGCPARYDDPSDDPRLQP
ncbi:MAG: D-alanyl-D-alanine carboxypeptidase family protein [Micrococcales bacterium]|nr:D-alanyl-D-alanine carboxypeptidase family protein [Micrococcales bacterium]